MYNIKIEYLHDDDGKAFGAKVILDILLHLISRGKGQA